MMNADEQSGRGNGDTQERLDTGNGTVPSDLTKTSADKGRGKSISMHDGVAVSSDCCTCAAEPYWLEVAEELGIDLGSDNE